MTETGSLLPWLVAVPASWAFAAHSATATEPIAAVAATIAALAVTIAAGAVGARRRRADRWVRATLRRHVTAPGPAPVGVAPARRRMVCPDGCGATVTEAGILAPMTAWLLQTVPLCNIAEQAMFATGTIRSDVLDLIADTEALAAHVVDAIHDEPDAADRWELAGLLLTWDEMWHAREEALLEFLDPEDVGAWRTKTLGFRSARFGNSRDFAPTTPHAVPVPIMLSEQPASSTVDVRIPALTGARI